MQARRAAWVAWICEVEAVRRAGRVSELFRSETVYQLDSYGLPPRARAAGRPESRGARPPNPRNTLNPASAGFFLGVDLR